MLQPDEHEGAANRSNAQIKGFRDTVDVCMLMDLGYQGRFWTFEKRIAGGSYARVRLDRALATASWVTRFPDASVTHLTSSTSDHGTILVQLDGVQSHALPEKTFRYEVMWESHETWKDTITNSWNAASAGYGVGDFCDKLLTITSQLSSWRRDTFGSVRKEIKHIKAQLETMHNDPARLRPSHPELKLNERLVELYHREELMWRQRSWLEWLSAGDRNTKFFHMRASMRRKKNMIRALTNALGLYYTLRTQRN